MTYDEAVKLKNENLNLIGSTDEKGFTIGEIIILPIDENEQKAFFKQYLISWDCEIAVFPYRQSDLQVWTIDTDYLKKASVLFYNILGK